MDRPMRGIVGQLQRAIRLQSERISSSRRATVRLAQPSCAAISLTVYPSSFNTAIRRTSSSRNAVEAVTILLGELLGELGGGLGAGDPVEPGRLVVGSVGAQVGLGADSAATALQPPRTAHLVRDLAFGDDDQEPPEVVAVVQPGEAALSRGAAEAVEGTQRRILLILGRPGPSVGAQSGLGQPDQAGEVRAPRAAERRRARRRGGRRANA